MHRLRSGVALLGALVIACSAGVVPAGAAAEHRALVVVDTGTGVIRRTITFTEDSISGIAALQRAGAEPVVYTYSGQGGAVCRLFGVGRDAGPNCLGGGDGDARYWAYWRAPSGTAAYTYSRVGAGATAVHDGDVEGWRFGTGAAPPWSPVPPPAPTGTTAAPPPPAPAAAPPAGSGGATMTPAAPGTDPAAGSPGSPGSTASTAPTASTTAPGALPATGARPSAARPRTREAAARRALTAPGTGGGGSGPPWSLLVPAGLLAALGTAIVLVRRTRRAPRAP
jgi:hypothetical protein